MKLNERDVFFVLERCTNCVRISCVIGFKKNEYIYNRAYRTGSKPYRTGSAPFEKAGRDNFFKNFEHGTGSISYGTGSWWCNQAREPVPKRLRTGS